VTLRTVSLNRISNLTLALVAGAMAVGAISGTMHAPSIAAGGAVMLVNFHLLRMLVSLLIRPGLGPWAPVWTLGLLTLKLTIAIVVVAGVLYRFPVAPLSFAAGSSMLVVAAVFEAVIVGEPLKRPVERDRPPHA